MLEVRRFLIVSKTWAKSSLSRMVLYSFVLPRPRRRIILGVILPLEGINVVSFQSPVNLLSMTRRESLPLSLQSIHPLVPLIGLSS